MAFFSDSVDALMRSDLHDAYEDLAYGGSYASIVGLFRKVEKSGDSVTVPIKTDFSPGLGGDAATSYANAGTAQRFKFIVLPFKCYNTSTVDMSQDIFTHGSDNSVAELLEDEAATCMNGVKVQLDQILCQSGYGELGTIASFTGTGPYTLTFAQRSDVLHLTGGATYVTKVSPAAAALDTGSFTVNKINANNLTAVVTANGGWTPVNGHVYGIQGTMAASTSPITAAGIPGFIPPASARPIASNDNFYGINRSVNEMKLAGLYLDASGADATVGQLSILEGTLQLASQVADVPGAKPDTLVMTFTNKGKVVAEAQTQKRYVEPGKTQGTDISVFFDTVKVEGPTGPMDIVGSSNWPSNLVAVLTRSSWYLGSPNTMPFKPVGVDGLPFTMDPGKDRAVVQYRGSGFVFCDAPGWNGMLSVKA